MLVQDKSTIMIVTADEAKAIEIITLSSRVASQGSDITLYFLQKGVTVLRNNSDMFMLELIQLAIKLGVKLRVCSTPYDGSDLLNDDFPEGVEVTEIQTYLLHAEQSRINLVI